MTSKKELLEEIKKLTKKIEELEEDIDDNTEAIAFLRKNDFSQYEVAKTVEENFFSDKEEFFRHIENELPDLIDKAIDNRKIEDKVLLKVVKASFNNYKEEE